MTTARTIGELVYVPLCEGWAIEPKDFTPWLAANLPILSKAIGLPGLALVKTEHPVGRYRADILAQIPTNQKPVIIENQFGYADHAHLGQLITYMTGAKATLIIWVAEGFSTEHLATIHNLNKMARGDVVAIAVRGRLARIGESDLAPVFEVLARPDNWADWVKENADATPAAGERAALQAGFWEVFRSEHPEARSDIFGGGGSSLWRRVDDVGLVVSRWFSKGSVGVFVRGDRGAPISEWTAKLEPKADELANALGVDYGDAAYPFLKSQAFDTTDPAVWPAAAEWLYAEAERYAAGLCTVLKKAA